MYIYAKYLVLALLPMNDKFETWISYELLIIYLWWIAVAAAMYKSKNPDFTGNSRKIATVGQS